MVALHSRSSLKPIAGILPASYLATTNGRPTFPFKPQAHVGRASCPLYTRRPRMVALQSHSTLKPMGGHLARLVPSDHEWSPYIPVQASSPCRAGILPASYPATTNGRPTSPLKPEAHVGRASCPPRPRPPRVVALHKKENPPDEQSLSSEGFLN